MTAIKPMRRLFKPLRQYTELVIPADVSALSFDYAPPTFLGQATTFEQFVDADVLADLNACHGPGGQLERRVSPAGGRAIIFATPDSALLSSAPTPVIALSAQLVSTVAESYVLYSTPSGDCWIVSLRAEGLRHGAIELLRRLGVRYLAAHPSWKRLPKAQPITLNASEIVRPDILNFQFAPNGGLNTHGVQFAGTLLDQASNAAKHWYRWFVQCRHARGSLSCIAGDGGTDFMYYQQNALAADHTMLAWDGTRRGTSNITGTAGFPTKCFNTTTEPVLSKTCNTHHGTINAGPSMGTAPSGPDPWAGVTQIGPLCTVGTTPRSPGTNDPGPDSATPPALSDYTSFDGLTKIYCEHTWRASAQQVDTAPDVWHPSNYFVGVAPTDSAFQCVCSKCINLLRAKYGIGRNSTISDRVAELSNAAARYIAHMYQHSTTIKPGVAWSAYSDHSAVPTIAIEPNTAITVLPQTINRTTNIAPGEVMDQWPVKRDSDGFLLGVQSTWLQVSNYDMPRMSAYDGIEHFKRWQSQGYKQVFSSQTTYSNIAVGPMFYVLAELAWRPEESTDALLAEWFAAFGAAASAVRVMFERHWRWFELTNHEIGQCFRDMQTAQTALLADANRTQAQQDCLDHVRAWVQWLSVFFAFQNANLAYTAAVNGTTLANLLTAIDNAIQWCFNVIPFNCISADTFYGNLYNTIPASGTGTATLRAKWDKTSSGAAGWATVSTPTTATLTTAMATGASAFSLISGVTRHNFEGYMYPFFSAVTPVLHGTLVPVSSYSGGATFVTARCTAYQTYTFVKKTSAPLPFTLMQARIGSTPGLPCRMRVLDAQGNTLQSFESLAYDEATYQPTVHTITVPAGTYTLEVNDDASCRQSCYLVWPKSAPFVWHNPFVIGPGNEGPTYTEVRLYFYVPAGETRIAFAFDGFEAPVFWRPNGTNPTVTQAGPNSFWVDCTGLAGQVWSWSKIRTRIDGAYPHFENCPNTHAFDPTGVMVPAGLDGY